MYNRYIPDGAAYTRVRVEEEPPSIPPQEAPAWEPVSHPTPPKAESLGGLGGLTALLGKGGSAGGLTALLKSFKLENLDSGDILLLLIILLLLLEGDNLELVIALGLVLIMSLGEDKEKSEQGAD